MEHGRCQISRNVISHVREGRSRGDNPQRALDIPVLAAIAEWFRNEFRPQKKRSWGRGICTPAVLCIAVAMLVVGVSFVMERINEFPGSVTARKMLTIAASVRRAQLYPLDAEAGSLGDLLFMKYRLERYDIPREFAALRTSACRVFDDDGGGGRVAQIIVPNERMQFFLFPVAQIRKDVSTLGFSGWRFVEDEDWAGAVQVRGGICFMAAVRGRKQELAFYLSKANEETSAAGLGR